ncbi:MAG: type 1 glutamine amidotransferase [Planctomycetota bacterium]
MAHITVFEFDDWRTSGRIGATLRDHGFRLDVRRPDRDGVDAVPGDLDNIGGLLVMGGAQNVDEGHAWLSPLGELIRGAHERELPVIGVCLGAQIIAQALGGSVAKADTPEGGFEPVTINTTGQVDTMLAGVPWTTPQLCFHAYEVTELPAGATSLASSASCKHHIFRAGIRTLGLQSHPEVVQDDLHTWAHNHAEFLRGMGKSPEDVLREGEAHFHRFARAADRLCVNLANFVFPFDRLLAV